MSGGANRKKTNKIQGWEDAGVEFYQENYLSNEVELQDVLQRDPKHLTTLLPSKQNRAYATMRVRCTDTRSRTVRRQTLSRTRRENSIRRPSTTAEVQVSLLPDLSEPISNEQTAWEQIMRIKELPVNMSEKKEMKLKIQNSPNLRLQGYEQFRWKRRKFFDRFKQNLREVWSRLELWQGDLKRMEGNFGTGMVAYFTFIKWLLFFNLIVFITIFLFLTLPVIAGVRNEFGCKTNTNHTQLDCCLESYLNSSVNHTSVINIIQDTVQGTGAMEYTLFFHGMYFDKLLSYTLFDVNMYYSLSLAYVSIVCMILLMSLFTIVKEAAEGFKYKIIEGEGQYYKYCNLAFGSWDFCIHNSKAAKTKQKAIHNEVKNYIEVERVKEEKKNRTKRERTKIAITCVIVNLLVLAILVLCACLIYVVFEFSSKKLTENPPEIEELIYKFMPSLTIVCLNTIVPLIFNRLVSYEKYSPTFTVYILMIRMIFLRLSSVIVFYCSMYTVIVNNKRADNCMSSEYKCWETFVGQHIYRLVLTDFALHVFITFVVNFPRGVLDRRSKHKIAKFIGEQNFDLPKHVLDIVYIQTLCWLGTYYAPLLPAVVVVIFFLMFYIKKFACTVNSKPCKLVHRASSSKSMFMNMLLISFVVAASPVIYTVGELEPSDSCGPFRNLATPWEIVIETVEGTPDVIRYLARLVTTASFTIPLFIILILLLYYYSAVNNANRHMVRVLKDQLVLEGHDKQFLLERLSTFIKQQQEVQKQLRRYEGDMNLSSH